MVDEFPDPPNRLEPYISMAELNEPVAIAQGPFRLIGSAEGTLDADLFFRWVPSCTVAFAGSYSVPHIDLEHSWTLESDGALRFSAPAFITRATSTFGSASSSVEGFLQGRLNIGETSFRALRFSLANFPDYFGAPIRFERDGFSGLAADRLQTSSDIGLCRIDAISEAAELRKRSSRDAGFVISHVGEWIPASGNMSQSDAHSILHMLHFWFGFLRGAWAGPVFPQGLVGCEAVWREFAPWKLGESRKVVTWLPEKARLDLGNLFSGFVQRWNDPAWQGPLISSISWLVEANSSRSSLESKIVLTQVALDLLAWVHLVETQRLHSRAAFNRLSAAGRIRALLHHLGVSTEVPDYLKSLRALEQRDAFDGPGVITRVRNALVHSNEESRTMVGSLCGPQLLECSQLALQYVELAILAVCQHSGHYARRGWKGWKGDDEARVPWEG